MTIQNPEVFEGKNFQDILEDIYNNTQDKKRQITILMNTLSDMIVKPSDAAVIAPLVKDFFDVSVKNDEHLVKIAAIVQRAISAQSNANSSSNDWELSDLEKDELRKQLDEEVTDDLELVDEEEKEIDKLNKKSKKILESYETEMLDGTSKDNK